MFNHYLKHRHGTRIPPLFRLSRILILSCVVLVCISGAAAVTAVDATSHTDESTVAVTIDGTNSPVVEGETLTVEVTVVNLDTSGHTGSVIAEVEDTTPTMGSDRKNFGLSEGDERTFVLEIPTEAGDAGEYTVTVTADLGPDIDEDRTTVTIVESEDELEDEEDDEDTDVADLPEVEVTEEEDEYLRFTLTEDSNLDEMYLAFEDDWESARFVSGLEEGASVTVRTEDSARELLESEDILIPDTLINDELESREATDVDRVTCLYDHDGYTVDSLTVPSDVHLPCHAPVLSSFPGFDGGTGTSISLREGEYRLVGIVDGGEIILASHTVESVGDTDVPETDDEEEEAEETDDADDTDEETEEEAGDTDDDTPAQSLSLRDIGVYLGIGAIALMGFAFLMAMSVFVVRMLKDTDWGGEQTEEEEPRIVLDTDSENVVYVSWSGLIEHSDIEDFRTKTPSEIAERAKDAGLDPGAVDELTDVFEEVRYGDGEPTPEQEKRAKRAFERIKRSARKEQGPD